MKLSKLLLLTLIVLVFAYSNLSSHQKFSNESDKPYSSESFTIKKELGKDYVQNEYFNQKNRNAIQFDQNSVIDSIIITSDDGDKEKHTYTFNANGNMILDFQEYWDGSKWINYGRGSYTYDSNGKMTTYLTEVRDGTEWVNFILRNYTYNQNGNITSFLREDWDGNQWGNQYRETYTYDSNNNLILYLVEIWSESQWENLFRKTYTYDDRGNKILKLKEVWDDTKWVNSMQKTFTYSSNGNISSELYEHWDGANWINLMKYTYTYDRNMHLISLLREEWNETQWVNYFKRTYTYNHDDNITSEITDFWDSPNSQWINSWQKTYTYDSNGNIVSYLSQKWDSTKWILADCEFSFTDSFNNHYYLYGSEIKYYYSRTTSIEKSKLKDLNYSLSQNYPNPFNPTTTISYTIPKNGFVQLKVYDILGKEVATLVNKEQSSGKHIVEFNALSALGGQTLTSGIYFYRMQSGNFVETKQFILLK